LELSKELPIVLLSFVLIGTLISYGGATGLSEVDTTNTFGPGMDISDTEEDNYLEEDEIDSSALIDGFKERLRFAKSFSVDDEYVSVIKSGGKPIGLPMGQSHKQKNSCSIS